MWSWVTRGDGIDALRAVEQPVPTPGPGQVLMRVRAISVNYRDLLVIGGVGSWAPTDDVVPISDGAGEIIAAAPDVSCFSIGDHAAALFLPKWHRGPLTADEYVLPVGGPTHRGMLSEYVIVDQHDAVRLPDSLPLTHAATLPVAGITAWHALTRLGVRAGDTVLVHGTGGVALFALQLATAIGARVAITSSSQAKLDRAAKLGAALGINRLEQDVAAAARDWTGGVGVDHVIETVGGSNLNISLAAVRISGSIGFIGLIAGLAAPVNTYEFVTRNVTIHGIETGSREQLEALVDFVDRQHLTPAIDTTYPVADVRTALHRLETGDAFGKIVITMDRPASHH
jgi:NADPH:quinone reductase-like Zn-dependent oxidoreductase